jgi:murein tripeptide amidase MpaA
MKMLIHSENKFKVNGTKWFYGGHSIKYQRYFPEYLKESTKACYALTFSYTFEQSDDTVSFAFSEPYSYTDLQSDLLRIERSPKYKRMFTRKTLCTSISGLACDVLTITNNDRNSNKKTIVLTARVHPGETVGSWIMKGVIEYLLGTSYDAEFLRDNFIFKIVPMINPDGVVQGNYRCSFSACDLNRRYTTPSKLLHPEIYYLKEMVHKFASLAFYCDFHGHSRKYI